MTRLLAVTLVRLTASDIATAWPYIDVPAQISDWLAREGYPGGLLHTDEARPR